ncbi:hypothetical protein M427DRAFT_56683 [Gonapodya prolifera JEL478]|uniref:C2H2-type domain-containing protein n=1 Tax=Gonapodya prolifera (strain JEL478) TaxID=1344416 RepID=A0A139AFY1_GONPJ|nr:hypothetical protein M427DRAFT_56683 [Gonapodya prolifera JEL478]|eukprot:KXS15609.1 hypothetical protein M427DRAFT_56683 [Gonapodya prolifera JEL478]
MEQAIASEKAFQCPRCKNTFTRKDVMIRHTTRKVCKSPPSPSLQQTVPQLPALPELLRSSSPIGAFPAKLLSGSSPQPLHRPTGQTENFAKTKFPFEGPNSVPTVNTPLERDTRLSHPYLSAASPPYRPSTPQGASTSIRPQPLQDPALPNIPPLSHLPDRELTTATNVTWRHLSPILREEFVPQFGHRSVSGAPSTPPTPEYRSIPAPSFLEPPLQPPTPPRPRFPFG